MRPRGPMPARGWLALAVRSGARQRRDHRRPGRVRVADGPDHVDTGRGHQLPEITAPLPDLGGPHSRLVPEMSLPVGARPYTGKPTPPGFEFWEVPGGRHDLVAQMQVRATHFRAR